MSLLDNYRREVVRRSEELAKLQSDKAKELNKIASITTKVNSAIKTASRSKSASTIASKNREIERYNKGIAASQKKVANFEKKIAQKQKDLNKSKTKVAKEEAKLIKQQNQVIRANTTHTASISQTLDLHSQLHKETRLKILELQNLPEEITVLFLASNPIDQNQLRLDEEARSILEMIRKAQHRDSVKFETRWAIRPLDILQAINELKPTIIHFSGHGTDEDEIVFQDADGYSKIVSLDAIVQTIKASSDSVRFVFFNTCYSFGQAEIVVQHVEAAIGMNVDIGDDAARIFASQFYSAISFGRSLDAAFQQAKALLMMENIPEETTPELFVQNGLSASEIIIVRPPTQ